MSEGTHRYGKMEWVFYIIILPLLFTALLSGVILQFLGFDMTGKIATAFKSLPGMHQTASNKPSATGTEKQLQDAQDKVKTLEKTEQQLQDDLTKKNSEIDSLQKQITALKNPNASQQASNTNSTGSNGSGTTGTDSSGTSSAPDPLQTQVDVYEQMSASKAAAIMGNLPISQVKAILAKMPSDQEAAILQKMDPVVASKILSEQ